MDTAHEMVPEKTPSEPLEIVSFQGGGVYNRYANPGPCNLCFWLEKQHGQPPNKKKKTRDFSFCQATLKILGKEGKTHQRSKENRITKQGIQPLPPKKGQEDQGG